jgi:hypothetical protein
MVGGQESLVCDKMKCFADVVGARLAFTVCDRDTICVIG